MALTGKNELFSRFLSFLNLIFYSCSLEGESHRFFLIFSEVLQFFAISEFFRHWTNYRNISYFI